jgi:hypothetical protein
LPSDGGQRADYYRWKKQFDGLEMQQIRRRKLLEEENRKLKQLVVDLSLDRLMLRDVASQRNFKAWPPAGLVRHLKSTYAVSERRVCVALLFDPSSHATSRSAAAKAVRAMRDAHLFAGEAIRSVAILQG